MTNLRKAMIYLDGMGMDYDIVGGKMFVQAWNRDNSESYEFQVAQEEIDEMAQYHDARIKPSGESITKETIK